MNKFKTYLSMVVLLATMTASAEIGPRHDVSGRKTGKYQSEGFFAGGDREVTNTKLKDIRRAMNEGAERVVLDLEGAGIPYFQVQNSNHEGRIVVSLWSDVQYDFDPAKINKAFAKSSHISKVKILPRVEDGLSVLEFQVRADSKGSALKLETFYLTKPNRLILDIL